MCLDKLICKSLAIPSTDFRTVCSKVIHYHGDSDNSMPAASSVLYHNAIRRTMDLYASANESYAALND